ncbi:hypothetical protein B0H16DRAFT_1749488 [Mycena metata]|uniref:Uncharacterized protein n=1 Tax=Mycena metata TaxID=1033252 RepID=A0AAD7GQ37_9AGAR|nr:hypothetical protein B0H16DRAFT_1749488 [Mycena metata]
MPRTSNRQLLRKVRRIERRLQFLGPLGLESPPALDLILAATWANTPAPAASFPADTWAASTGTTLFYPKVFGTWGSLGADETANATAADSSKGWGTENSSGRTKSASGWGWPTETEPPGPWGTWTAATWVEWNGDASLPPQVPPPGGAALD